MDGIEIADLINKKYQIPFIYLTSYADRSTVDRAKHTRPMGYIVKPFDDRDLFTTLEIALHNFSESQPKIELDLELLNSKVLAKITQKEFEILISIFEGKTNRQMADQHFISLNTIKTHVKNLYDKLDVHTRTQAIAKLREMSSYHAWLTTKSPWRVRNYVCSLPNFAFTVLNPSWKNIVCTKVNRRTDERMDYVEWNQ